RTWYVRRAIPLALRPFADGRREVLKSLRTGDEHEARVLSLKVNLELEAYLNSLRAKQKRAAGPLPTPDELAALHTKAALMDEIAPNLTARDREALDLAYSNRFEHGDVSKLL